MRIHFLPTVRTTIWALIAVGALHAGEAHAQDTLRVGGVRLHAEADTADGSPRPLSQADPASRSAHACERRKIVGFQEVNVRPDEWPMLLNPSELRRALNQYYPAALAEAGISGTVEIRVRVLASGVVERGTICVDRASHDEFGRAAMRAVERARFRPARIKGKLVDTWMTLPIVFSLAR